MATLIEVKPAPQPKIKSVTVELTAEEVNAMLTVFNFVGGLPGSKSRRGLISEVARCLSAAIGDSATDGKDCSGGGVYFSRTL